MVHRDYYHINRTLCEVLEEMRACYKTCNFAPLMGLIEEAQTMANRMEAALSDVKDVKAMQDEWHEMREKIKQARHELKEVTGDDDGDD